MEGDTLTDNVTTTDPGVLQAPQDDEGDSLQGSNLLPEGIPAGANLQRKSSVQFLVNSSSSKLAAITGLMLRSSPSRTLAADTVSSEGGGTWSPGDSRDRPFDIDSIDDSGSTRNGGSSRASSTFSVATGLRPFRSGLPLGDQSAAGDGPKQPACKISNKDLRRTVYHHERDRRTVSGLRVHAFTRQAFFSSFAVGLAIGSILAIILKILKDLTFRIIR